MSSNKEDEVDTSPNESDEEKTIIEAEEPSVAELQEEILALRKTLAKFMESANSAAKTAQFSTTTTINNASPSTTPTYTQLPLVTSLSQLSATVPAAATNYMCTMSDTKLTSVATAQQPNLNTSEYSTQLRYMPLTTTQSFTSPLPYTAPQSIIAANAPSPYIDSHSQPFPPVTSAPYNHRRPLMPTTIPLNNNNPLPSLVDFAPQRLGQICIPTQSRMTPAPSTYIPTHSASATFSMPASQSTNDFRQLRKLHDLPQFSGHPEQWPMFIVSYRETTANYNYTNLENLIRLQKSLTGDARSKVEAFLIHPESVDQVVSTLEFHYGRPQVLIRSQIAKVRSFPPITAKRIHDLVGFSTMVSNLSVFLMNANATPHLNNPTLLDELISKLPLHKREEWTKHAMTNLGSYPSVHDFSLWLQEVATYIYLSTEADTGKNDCVSNRKDKMNPSFTIIPENNKLTKCLICHLDHQLYNCKKFKEMTINDRWKFVKNNHLCFGCLRAGHNTINCKNRRQCGIFKCNKYHNKLLHDNNKPNEREIDNNQEYENFNKLECKTDNTIEQNKIYAKSKERDKSSVNTIVDNSLNKETLFKYLPVELKGPKGTIKVLAFIDEGSKITLLEEEIANTIGLKGASDNLRLGWIGGKTTDEISKRINLEISGSGENASFQMKNEWTTTNLKLPRQSLQLERFRKSFPVLNEIIIEDYIDVQPKLLIGLPHIRLVRPIEILNLNGCFAVHRTSLGNVLFGSNEDSTGATVCKIDFDILSDINEQVLEYFTLENLGVKVLEPIVSNKDRRAEEILRSTTKKKGRQYETGLLWRNDNFVCRNSYSMAMKRLFTMETKMKKDKELDKWYKEKINDYIFKSYARKLLPEEAAIKNNRTWYLPHFVVTNINKVNKRRLVFDAAACVEGESFNSRLLKGPNKYQPKSLLSILFRFRQREIGVCADIKEMFHRVAICEQDQTAQRFLWRDGNSNEPPDEYVMQVMIFGSASSPCSAQFVKNINAEIYKDTHPKAYRAIIENHYVDDYVDCFASEEEAIEVARDVVNIHYEAGFELRGFVSNSSKLLAAIGEKELKSDDLSMANLGAGESSTEKILGMRWSPSDDCFCFALRFMRVPEAVLNGGRKPTKSEMLSLTMSIFDPFGFLANIIIKSKILLQELWRCKVDWMSPIPDEIYSQWFGWYKSLQKIELVKIPRCYGRKFVCNQAVVDLHIFVDASEMAFAAVAYWRIIYDNEVNIVFIAGKSRCAPLKPLSIPRLELQAAVLGIRLKESIITGHDIKPGNILFWSDSKTVIKWIQSDCRTYKQFVAHRISEILESSRVEQWKWVPGAHNPADEATRPRNFTDDAIHTSRWLNGPMFLKDNEQYWPELPGNMDEYNCQVEKRSKYIFTVTEEIFIPFDRYSSFRKLVRVMCWIQRAVKKFRTFTSSGKGRQNTADIYGPQLSARELADATNYLCKLAQRDLFYEEYKRLEKNKPVPKTSTIYKLTPFIRRDGLICLSGRTNKATCIDYATKEPIILPKNHQLTKLIVKQYHEDFRHQNQESICAAIRLKYWIPSLRQLVRSASRNCQECRNRSAFPKPPLMGQHPEDRLTPYVRPFSYTGMDYIGPYIVSIGRRHEKRWVAIFTCLTTRAIHLEIAKDLSTDAVILCIRNFINRRGLPVRIRSDRGTNFVGASKEQLVFDVARVMDECTRRGIEWLFNTPANPSAGGAWERMVRSVKSVLAFTLKERAPQVETFHSLLIEAENLINSRPLTHLPIEHFDADPLTPNHFLLGCPNILQTPGVPEGKCLRKQWQILQQLKQTFWKRWILEYLPDLTRRTKWYQPVKPLKEGNVVVICDDNETRGQWKRGVVEEVFLAADGQVRSAIVRTTNGRLRRPASKLAVLDVGGESPWSTHGGRNVMN